MEALMLRDEEEGSNEWMELFLSSVLSFEDIYNEPKSGDN